MQKIKIKMAIEVNFIILLIVSLLEEIFAHGVMQSPPARNYMWRLGFNTERNYDDMGLNCGGFSNQWDINGGRCGTCGDPFQGPRAHEAGGRFARYDRPVSQCYNKNDKIDVNIRITAYHRGYFEFRLCEQNDLYTPVSQDCLNRRLLTLTGTNQTRYDIGYIKKEFYTFQLNIPKDVTCDQCVIQWLYNTGNSYGCDFNGCGVAVGKQEQFINCADIAVLPDCRNFALQTTTSVQNSQEDTTNWDQSYHTRNQWTDHQHGQWSDRQQRQWTTHENIQWTGDDDDEDDNEETDTFADDRTTVWRPTGLATRRTTFRSSDHNCYAIGMFADVPDMNYWCDLNCNAEIPFCPKTHCRCGDDDSGSHEPEKICFAVGLWAQLAGFSDWCLKNCNHDPSFCPRGVCRCF